MLKTAGKAFWAIICCSTLENEIVFSRLKNIGILGLSRIFLDNQIYWKMQQMLQKAAKIYIGYNHELQITF